jgi:putative membrane protein
MSFDMMYPYWMWGFGGLMIVGIVAFLAVLGLIIYLLVRDTYRPSNRDDRALALARDRYARGEITLEQFEEIREHIE